MARPLKEIDWNVVEKHMEAGCSAKEIAGLIRADINTFYDRFKLQYNCNFADYYDKLYSAGNSLLRFVQFEKALEGNTNMLILLGKERLEQGKEQEKISPYEAVNTMLHEIMLLKDEIVELKGNNANKSEAE